jgi:hypothetical protein
MRAPVEGGNSPSSASSTPALCNDLLYSIIFATASALGTASGAADPYPSGITIIMNRMELLLWLVLQRPRDLGVIDNDTWDKDFVLASSLTASLRG